MQSRKNSRASRSPSKSRSRSSEGLLDAPRLTAKSPSPACRRRASAAHVGSSTARNTSHNRSRSLRAKRHSAVGTTHGLSHSQSGTQLSSAHPSISHSLSVPDGSEGDFHLVRNFSLTSKGLVNRGDSFRRSKSTSLCSTPTSPESPPEGAFPEFTAATSGATASPAPKDVPKYRVWLIGGNGVGKTSIKNQFKTSEYICQYDTWKDENSSQNVTVSLDGEETELEIEEHAAIEEKNGKIPDPLPDAFLVVYSVTNRRSFVQARSTLSRLEPIIGSRAAILVGNKTDLARLKTVSTYDGRSLAKERGIKFIETSVAINHQLDELLVGVISQIRVRARAAAKKKKRATSSTSTSTSSKATCMIKRLWRRTCMTSKSCDNLHAL